MSQPPPADDDARLLDRILAGDATVEDRARWTARAAQDPALSTLAAELRARFDASSPTALDVSRADAAWRALAPRLRTADAPRPRVARRAWITVAAAAGVAVAGLGVWRTTTRRAPALVAQAAYTIVAPHGARREATLPDGTRLVLDAGGRMTYDGGYGRGAREVTLDGAAYFVVTHDAAHPFRVRTRAGVAEDLGTRFVVRAYAEAADVEVAVAEGRVAVRGTAPSAQRVELGRGQLARLATSGAITVASDVDVDARLGWTHGELAYADTPLADALPQLARWYDVDIRLADRALASRRLTARFVAGQPPHAVLDAVAIALGAHVDWQGRVATLIAGAAR